MTARGCGAAALFALAALLAYVSFGATVEMETFPGFRPNHAGFAVFSVVLAVLSAWGGLAVAGRRSRLALAATVCVAAALTWRMYTLAPALHCWEHNTVGRNDDGSYDCFDL
ncbi:hypothetical protein OHS70_25280 [Streptomyces sp. NBC_00390]|uniref:hypothetical protein n=1 Tax=unclassified Streptomyces TaxID=2593676 RepID=UPI002E1E3CB3